MLVIRNRTEGSDPIIELSLLAQILAVILVIYPAGDLWMTLWCFLQQSALSEDYF